jgi:dolichol-phosphate mannosyltransferase
MILITFLIPVFNEEKTVINSVNQILSLKFLKKEIIIIDNGSTDQSQKLIKTFSGKKNIRIVLRKKNLGYGASIKQGVRMARGKYMFIQFSDTEYDHRVSLKMFRMSEKYNAHAVFGSRFIKNSKITNYPLFKLILNRIFNFFVSLFFCYSYNDYTNAFKIYKRETLLKLFPLISEKFNIFLEIPLKIISRKYTFEIIPIIWKSRKIGFSKFYIKELRSHYLFTFFYCLLEKILIKK